MCSIICKKSYRKILYHNLHLALKYLRYRPPQSHAIGSRSSQMMTTSCSDNMQTVQMKLKRLQHLFPMPQPQTVFRMEIEMERVRYPSPSGTREPSETRLQPRMKKDTQDQPKQTTNQRPRIVTSHQEHLGEYCRLFCAKFLDPT